MNGDERLEITSTFKNGEQTGWRVTIARAELAPHYIDTNDGYLWVHLTSQDFLMDQKDAGIEWGKATIERNKKWSIDRKLQMAAGKEIIEVP